MSAPEPELLPDESPDIVEDLGTVIADLPIWLDRPNSLFGVSPRELLGTQRGVQMLRNMIRMIRNGDPT